MNKKILVGILVVVTIFACFYLYKSQTMVSPQKEVRDLIAQKYNKPANAVEIKTNLNTGTFAKGTVNFEDNAGGVWFAAKTANGWELVFDGNGIVPCDAADKYGFPKDIIPQCIDTQHDNNLIQRDNPSWEKIKSAIMNCEVASTFQAHSLDVSVKLKDGTRLTAVEPNLDDIIGLAVEAEPKCGRIIMSTE